MTGTSQQWRKQQAGKPNRPLLTCRRAGYEPRTVVYQVPAVLGRRASIGSADLTDADKK
jgi:hypothetical protein